MHDTDMTPFELSLASRLRAHSEIEVASANALGIARDTMATRRRFGLAASWASLRTPVRAAIIVALLGAMFIGTVLAALAILGGVLLISRIEDGRQAGLNLREAVMQAAAVQMRPILMATVAAAIGLLPAAVATGIGSQAQKPLARVVVGGMLTAAFLILVVLPVLYEMVHRRTEDD